jgi:hypothetical protein
MDGHRLGVILTTMSHEDYSTLCDMAFRTNEGMVLEATDSHRVILGHVQQDHLSAARRTTHRSHTDSQSTTERPPAVGTIDIGPAMLW